jgi:sporulation protein YlmC with PRC-barrel domain
MQQDATTALDEFDAALTQVSAEGDQRCRSRCAAPEPIAEARQQLTDDPANAGEDLRALAEARAAASGRDIPAEADAIVGRQVVTRTARKRARCSDVLVTADGQVEALLIERGGALGLGGQQVAVTWDQLQLQGDQITINMTQDEIEQLPEYQTE